MIQFSLSVVRMLAFVGLSTQVFAADAPADIELKTAASNPETATAHVGVRPAYYLDPDGSGVGPATAKDDKLVARWDFEDSTSVGPYADKTGISEALVKTGSSVSLTNTSVSKALSLGGSSYVSGVLDAPNEDSGDAGTFTLSFWFKISSTGTDFKTLCRLDNYFSTSSTVQRPFVIAYKKESSTQRFITLRVYPANTSNQLTSAIYTAPATNSSVITNTQFNLNFVVPSNLEDGGWHHLVVTYDRSVGGSSKTNGGPFAVYLDSSANRLQTQDALNYTASSANASYAIYYANSSYGTLDNSRIYYGFGVDSPLGNYFAGSFDRARVFRKVLAASEVATLMNQDLDGDGTYDRVEVNQGADALDPKSPENLVSITDDQNLAAVTAGKSQLGTWDFETLTGAGNVQNLKSTTGNGDLTLGGAALDDGTAMPSRSARFDGGSVMQNLSDLNWGSVSNYSSSAWVRFQQGGKLSTSTNRVVIWSLQNVFGANTRMLFTVRINPSNGREQFELISINSSGASGALWPADRIIGLTNGGWHHVTLVKAGGAYSLYVDGASMGAPADIGLSNFWQGQNFSSTGVRLEVGGASSYLPGYTGFEGNIDRLRFWGVSLDKKDAANLYLQDYDGDQIPDFAEVADSSLHPLVADAPTTADGAWDQAGIAGTDVTTGLLAHWNFESFRYGSSGRYFENQKATATLPLVPNGNVVLSNSEGLASYFASFRGAGNAKAVLGNSLAGKSSFAIAGWLKVNKDSIWELPGIPTPLWEIQNYFTGTQSTDSMKLYAIRLGLYTQIFLANFDPATGANGPNVTRWLLPRDVRIDNEDWHHLVFQREGNTFELYLDTRKLSKTPTDGYPDIVAVNFTNTDTTETNGTVFRIGSGLIAGKEYGLKGGWDRIRIYTQALSYKSDGSSPSLIHALYRQDADLDGVSDLNEIGIVGRSPILSETGSVVPPGTDLTKVDIEGLPKSLSEDPKLLGLWDFENLADRATGFAEFTGRGLPMIPSGSTRDVGIDFASGVPSRSVFLKNGGYVASDAAQLKGCKEFSASLWMKTTAGFLERQPSGFSIMSLEDLQGSGSSNTLTLRVQKSGASQALIIQPFSTQSGFLKIGAGGVGRSLLNQRLDDGKWHHIVWVRRSKGSLVYVDGKFLDTNVGTGSEFITTLNSPSGVTPRLVLGRTSYRAPELAMDGSLDRLRFYGRALEQEEVLSLYNQDFDRDGFSDIQEIQNFGFDPFHAPPNKDSKPVITDWDDDTGIAATEAASLRTGLAGAWNFELLGTRVGGDGLSALRFPTERVEGVSSAIAEGGIQWDTQSGLLSKSLSLARDGYLKLPAEIMGAGGDKLTASFWVRLAKDEISNQAKELELTQEKLALLTWGDDKEALPKVVVSLDYRQQIVAQVNFQRTYMPGTGYTSTELARWYSPARLDDGRWHHVVINLKNSGSNVSVDGFGAELASSSIGSYPGYQAGVSDEPYFWMGFRKNQLLDPANLVASQLPFRGFTGSLDRIRIYKRTLTDPEIQALYAQDHDLDSIPDVTETNSALNPYTPDVVISTGDYDKDGLTNSEEATLGTSWWKPDSEGDWTWDGWEQKYDGAPDSFKPMVNDRAKRDQDQDGDGLTGLQEFFLGTNPDNADTDGDGTSDFVESSAGSSPLNASSVPAAAVGGTEMTRGGILPGGAYKPSSGGNGDPSYSFNGQDATGPRYRKISLNGRPLADQAPETEGETDHYKEETYVDAFSLGLHHDTSLIYVPVPASDLTLQVSMSLQSESWSNRSGIRPLEKLTSPFGPCWSSNICAYVEETTEVGGEPDTGATPSPKFSYSAVDEDGRSLRFGSYNGVSIFAYPSSLSDRKSYQHELKRSSETTLVLKKKFGTTLTYEKVALDQAHYTNRAGECDSFQQHRYYRLVTVTDRYGNTVSYTYPSAKTLIPSVIGVTNRPDLRMEITVDPLDPHRVKSVKDPRGYVHQFAYAPLSIPNGAVSATASVSMLVSVADPLGQATAYAYASGYEGDYTSNPVSPTHYFNIDLAAITNKRGVTTTFAYEVDDDKYSSSLQFDGRKINRIYGLPRLVKTVRSAASVPAGLPGDSQVEQIAEFSRRPGLRWFYSEQGVTVTAGGNQFIATNEWSNDVKNAVGKVTTYTFRDINAVLADTDTHGSSISLNWMIYYLEMDLIHPDSIGTEIYKFDLTSGLSLIQSTDICGNSTFYHYNDTWGGFSLIPSILGRQALFSKWSDPSDKVDALGRTESYAYSPNFRVMSTNIDIHGTRTETAVDDKGRRTSLVVTGADGKLLSQELFTYGDSRFLSFMTRKVTRAFENKSTQAWEADMNQLYAADANGRIASEAVDMNRSGTIDGGDLITTYAYDKNGNKISATDPRGNTTQFIYDPLNRLARVVYPPADGAAGNESRSKITLYDANGNKHAEIDENGYASISLHDALNRVVTQIRDMDGVSAPTRSTQTNLEGQTYDRLETEGAESIADLVSRNSYSDVDSILFKTDSRGITTATVYDAIERPLSIWENFSNGDTEASFAAAGDKVLTTFEYDKAGNTGGSIFNGDGFKPTRTIRKKATLMSTGGTEDVIVTHIYDKVYRPLSDTTQYEPGKSVTNLTSYNDTLYQATRTVAAGTSYARSTFTQFDGRGREVQTVDDYGSGRLNATSWKLYASTGQVYKTIDPLDRESESEYDAAGRLVKVWQARSDLAPGAAGFGKVDRTTTPTSEVTGSPFTTTAYDASGNVVSITNARGQITTSTYDARNRKTGEQQPAVDADGDPATPGTALPTTATFYDGVGNIIAQQNVRGHYTRSFYDRANRVIFTRSNPSTGNPSSAPSPTANNAYDSVSISTYDKGQNVLSIQDGNGNITRNKYDARNRLIVTATDAADGNPTDPNAPGYSPSTYQNSASTEIVVANTYDDSGNLVQVTDGEAHSTGFRYDGLARNTRTLWDLGAPLQRVAQSEFNGAFQTARVDPKGQRTEYVYDGLHRNTQTNYIGRIIDNRVNTYDLAGNLLTITYPNETTTGKTQRNCTQTYDALNRLLTEISAGQTHAYTYDKLGNRLTVTYSGGRYILSSYDALNRLQTASEKSSSTATTAFRVTNYGYDLAGNILRKILPNGVTTFTTYDALNRRLRMEDKVVATSAILSSFDYAQPGASGLSSGYDNVGNLLKSQETYTNSSLKNRTIYNAYDRVYRLTSETLDESGSGTGANVTVTTYGYDKANNRNSKAKQVNGVLAPADNLIFTFGNGTAGANTNQLTGYGPSGSTQTHTFSYDLNGSRTGHIFSGRTDVYSYDYENRLVTLNFQTGPTSARRGTYTYVYDHRTRRVLRNESSAGGSSTNVSFSGGVSVQERVGTSATITRQYIRGSDWGGGIGGILYSFDSSVLTYNHYNSRGDVVGQTGATGTVNWQAAYEAFGTRVREGGTAAGPQKANTKDEDPTGLLDEGMRYRDLESGVFITRDPAGFVDGPNVYTYVRQNPWSKFDPKGLEGIVISGQPGDHKNKTHFLSNGLNRAQKMVKDYSKSGSKETVKWMIYNDGGKGGYKKADLDAYTQKAAKAGVQVEIVDSARKISNYVNDKDGGRANDKISKFSYIGHATPGTLDVGYVSHGLTDNISYDSIRPRSSFKSSAFAEKSEINIVGGCRTAVAGFTSESVVDQFAHIVGKDSSIRGSTARIYYGGGVRTDDQLVNEAEEKGSVYIRRGMSEEEKEKETEFKMRENNAVYGIDRPY